MWDLVKAHHGGHNLSIETETLSLFVYQPIALQIFAWGTVPEFEGWVEPGGRVWYPVNVLHIRYNLFAGTEMLSLSVYKPITIQILLGGPSPTLEGRSGARGRVWYHMKAHHNEHDLSFETVTLSRFV